MTNFESLIENDVKDMLCYNNPWGVKKETNEIVKDCRHIACAECAFYKSEQPCSIDRRHWLNAEHEEPLLFPIGTPVEVPSFGDDTTELRYYWGTYHGLHFACKLKSTIGEIMKNGHPICESFDPTTIRKVGEPNA